MLIGRDREKRALDDLLDSAQKEESAVLVVRGEPGIGKSALLEYARQSADGMNVLRCAGIEVEHELAFAGMHQLVRPCLDLIERLPDPQAGALRGALGLSSDSVTDRFLVSLGLLSLLAECSEQGPVLCTIDDAQWLDRPSAEAVLFAARRLEAEPIAMVIAVREGEGRRFDAAGLPELELGGISDSDAKALLRQSLDGGTPPQVFSALIVAAGGNPLALPGFPAGLTPGQLDGTEPIVGPPRAHGVVEEQFRVRIEALPNACRRVLVLAAADEVAETGVISRAAERIGVELSDLEHAEDAGFVEVENTVSFRHPLVRSAAYRSAGRSERAEAHRALAAVIDEPARSVWHRAAVADQADESIAADLEAAATQAAARGAAATAAAAFERAAELSAEDARRGHRLSCAAQASLDGGRPDAAVALAARSEPLLTDPLELAAVKTVRAVELGNRGSPAEAHAMLQAAAEHVAEVAPDLARDLIISSLFVGLQGGWPERALEAVDRALAGLEGNDEPGDVERFGRALVDGVSAILAADATRARRLLDEALEAGHNFEGDRLALMPAYIHVITLDFPSLLTVLERGMTKLREQGMLANTVGVLSMLAGAQTLDRRVKAATSSIDQGLDLARQFGYENDETSLLALRARIAAMEGREHDCREDAEAAIRRSVANGIGWATMNARFALMELELGLGRPREALEQIAQFAGQLLPPVAMLATPELVDAAMRLGARARAEAAVDRFAAWSPVSTAPTVHGMLACCRAVLAEDRNQAERLFGEALQHHSGDAPFELARTQLAYGEWLRRERRKVEARTQLRGALDTFEGLGAALWAERARGELRATGETARKRDPSTVDDLTPQELRIARLVADGATNREVAAQLFVSPKTVEYHLRKIFMKLGVTSRVELARISLDDAAED